MVKQLHIDIESVRVCYFNIDLGNELALNQMAGPIITPSNWTVKLSGQLNL